MSTNINATGSDFADQTRHEQLRIRKIDASNLREALRKGKDDFFARPTHGLFIAIIYTLIALFTAVIGLGIDLLPLLFPLISGFALLGPIAACGLYSLSLRRENGQDYAWWHVFDVFTAPSRLAIAGMGIALAAVFVLWLYAAQFMYTLFLGPAAPTAIPELLSLVFTTAAGWQLLIVGCAVGFVFSVGVFVTTIISLPLLLDRKISLGHAVTTSIQAVKINARTMAVWFVSVAVLLFLGALPLLIGWAVVVPIVAHATWHLYRQVIRT